MRVHTSLDGVSLPSSSVAVGVFDGVHRGHQQVLRATCETARRTGAVSAALTFDRHPADLLSPQNAPSYLTSLRQKIEYIESLEAIDELIVVPFDLSFANTSPTEFVERILVARLGAVHVRVGADFRFGKGRAGSVMDLEAAGETHGFDVSIVHPITEGGERVSSTHIRSLVAAGLCEQAKALLGRPYTLRGTVGHGKKLGRTIGFPTANLVLDEPRSALPVFGVYAGWGLLGSRRIPAAISVGTNPTTDGVNQVVKVEAFLLDGFDEDIYDARLDIEIESHVRPELRFDGLPALIERMHEDVARVESILARR
ncbi:MAG: bifunctional riboflavin kinase/FAD synthetase [Capsulimonadaceae bacterium]|nr:bifunctional riboflavin kinase/FAD synthetase [Capsulimonadaceae bacterium]